MRQAIAVILYILCHVASATASTEPFTIDLSDSDPERIEDLPGILDSEIELLLSVCGPGRTDLCERLHATGIASDRLRAWAPYLDLPAAERVWIGTRIRSTTERDARGRLRSELKVTLSKGPVLIRWKGERRDRSRSGSDSQSREAILSVQEWGRLSLWLGTLTAGILGHDPWRNPVLRSGSGTPSLPRFQTRSAHASRGAAGTYGPVSLAIWRTANAGAGKLIALASARRQVWYGRRAGEGWGTGWEFDAWRLRVTGAVHRVGPRNSIFSVRLREQGRPADLMVAWSRASGSPANSLRLEAGSSNILGPWRLTGRLALIGSTKGEVVAYRGAVRLTNRASNRLSFGCSWDERATRAQLSRRVPLGFAHLDLDFRGLVDAEDASSFTRASVTRTHGLLDLDLSLWTRRGLGFRWSGIPADIPTVMSILLRHRHAPAKLEVRCSLPVRGITPPHFARLVWRIRIEPA